MRNSKISVCIITYNHEKYIRQCIEGVLCQELDYDYEIIIGEDCSKDGTLSICKELAAKYSDKIRLISRPSNIGMLKNWVSTIQECQGKYIAICEGDDYWTDPLKLQKQVDFLEKNPDYSLCFHDAHLMKQGQVIRSYVQIEKMDICTEDLFERHFIPTCSIVFRNSINFPAEFTNVASADKMLLFLASLKGKFRFINEPMGIYNLHEGGISNTHFGIKKVYDTAVLLSLFNDYCNGKFTELCYKSLMYEIEVHLFNKQQAANGDSLSRFKTKILFNEIVRRSLNMVKRTLRKLFSHKQI